MMKVLLDTDFLSAYPKGQVKAMARRQGAALARRDCLIAAFTVRLGMPVVTGNTADFRAIQRTGVDLAFENWRE